MQIFKTIAKSYNYYLNLFAKIFDKYETKETERKEAEKRQAENQYQ